MLQKPDVNIDMIMRIADFIEELPHWMDRTDNERKYFNLATWKTEHECGTSCCIAGWALMLSSDEDREFLETNTQKMKGASVTDIMKAGEALCSRAAKLLGISDGKANRLFQFMAIDVICERITPKQAVKVLHHLAVTGEVDWSIAAGDMVCEAVFHSRENGE